MKYLFEIIAAKLRQRNKYLLTAISVCIVAYIFLCCREYYANKSMQINGIVQNIQYDIKGYATVKVNDSTYDLGSNDWVFRGQVQKGDSLIKLKNSMTIRVVKQKTGKEMLFN